MKFSQKLLPLMLCVIMLVTTFAVTSYAADGATNVVLELEEDEVEVGETFTVTLSYEGMSVSSFAAGIRFDTDYLECVSIIGCDPDYPDDITLCTKRAFVIGICSTVNEANGNGRVGFVYTNTKDADYRACDIYIATFEAKKAGTTTITAFEKSDGADGFDGDADTQTLTIKGSEPACDHKETEKTYENIGDGIHKVICSCGETVIESEDCSGGEATCKDPAECEYCEKPYGEKNPDNHAWSDEPDSYTINDNGTHTANYVCGNNAEHTKSETDDHTYNEDGKCVCDAVKHECTLGHVEAVAATCENAGNKEYWYCSDEECGKYYSDAECNDEIIDLEAWKAEDGAGYIPATDHAWGEEPSSYTINNDGTHTANYVCGNNAEHTKSDKAVEHDYTYDTANHKCVCGAVEPVVYSGWTELNGEWYYYYENNTPAIGIARVPYPTEAINGVSYVPDQETIDYCAGKGKTFIDATETWFYFDDTNGEFKSDVTGIVNDSYAVNGMFAWNPGLVEVDGEIYYFIGDEENGGNTPANGDTYIIRQNGVEGFAYGEIYNFKDGQLSGLSGISNGKYYENSKLMLCAGLIKLEVEGETKYIYVRSNGMLAVGQYWVTKNNDLVNSKMYTFDNDGFLVSTKDPSVNGLIDGVYYKDGEPYYAGLIEIDGETYYVKSSGQVATGKYYITKVSEYKGDLDVKSGDRLNFGEDGKLIG